MSRLSFSIALRAAIALAGAMTLPIQAQAQIFAGVGPDRTVALPNIRLLQQTDQPVPVGQAITMAEDNVRHMPSTLDGWRVSGEIGTLRWPVYLTAAQAAAPLRFRVGYVSAISLLPDTSRFEVTINGTPIGSTPIDAARAMHTVEFVVPPGLAQHGYNAISIKLQQRHRVDCSVGATYELWTRFDPAETGLILAEGVRGIGDIADLPALLPKPDGSMPIHILLGGRIGAAHLKQLIAATQRIALVGHFLQPAVDFDGSGSDAYGVDLVLGTRATLGSLAKVASALAEPGPVARLLPASDKRRPTLLVTGSDAAELEQAIALLGTAFPKTGSDAGLMAIANFPAFKSDGAEHLRLRDLAMSSESFSGRFFRKSFNIALPADFLASDYGRGSFDLAGSYSPGLAHGAQVSVDVNGRSSGVIKLPYRNGDIFKHNQLFLPLSLMRPGLNRIDVFAETQRPEDGTCAAPDAKRFLLLDNSEIVLPRLARVQRLPDLALTTSGGLPYTQGSAHLVVPKPDRDTMGAALSLTARAAVAAGALIPFTFATKAVPGDLGSTLVVATAQTLDPALVKSIGVDPGRIEAAWRDLAPAPKPRSGGLHDVSVQPRWWLTNVDGPTACRLPAQIVPQALPSPATQPVVSSVTLETSTLEHEEFLDESPLRPSSIKGWLERLTADVMGRFDASVRSLHMPNTATARDDGITPRSSLILAQGFTGSADTITTIVTAPDAETLRASVACLFDPQVWSSIHGRLVALDASSGDIVATDAAHVRYIASGPWSLMNSRLVLAGWFSLNPLMFVLMALMTALCLSATTFWFVRGIGRRSE